MDLYIILRGLATAVNFSQLKVSVRCPILILKTNLNSSDNCP